MEGSKKLGELLKQCKQLMCVQTLSGPVSNLPG